MATKRPQERSKNLDFERFLASLLPSQGPMIIHLNCTDRRESGFRRHFPNLSFFFVGALSGERSQAQAEGTGKASKTKGPVHENTCKIVGKTQR